jgi:cbb3-type cytochrome oxidase subunit 3
VCNPTEALAQYCTVLSGQMKILVESEKEAADIIDSVRFTVKNGCDQNIFVESASSHDLLKVRYMSPNPSTEIPITPPTATKAEVNKSSSVVPYAISGIVIGIILFLILFLTAWFIQKRQQRRQTANETKADLSEDSDETKFEEPVYGNLGKQFPTQDVHRCMSMLCQQCRQLQQPTFLPTKLQQDHITHRDMDSA